MKPWPNESMVSVVRGEVKPFPNEGVEEFLARDRASQLGVLALTLVDPRVMEAVRTNTVTPEIEALLVQRAGVSEDVAKAYFTKLAKHFDGIIGWKIKLPETQARLVKLIRISGKIGRPFDLNVPWIKELLAKASEEGDVEFLIALGEALSTATGKRKRHKQPLRDEWYTKLEVFVLENWDKGVVHDSNQYPPLKDLNAESQAVMFNHFFSRGKNGISAELVKQACIRLGLRKSRGPKINVISTGDTLKVIR